jgi:transposase InsO family protein
MTHRNAPLTVEGRRRLVEAILAGEPVLQAAQRLRVSRTTAYRWVRRYHESGPAGLRDRSSRPHRTPRATPPAAITRILACRAHGIGPHRIGWALRMPRSTVYAVLRRLGHSRLADRDPARGTVIRYQRDHPGELIHLDIKRLGRIPEGGGKRADPGFDPAISGRKRPGPGAGWEYLHIAIDDASRLAYVEPLPDEKALTTTGFLARACAWFGQQGIQPLRVLTDNGPAYRSAPFRGQAEALGIGLRRTRPYRPQTNGKAERFIQTLLREFAYRRRFTSTQQRTAELPIWVDHYNRCRPHTSLDGRTPFERVTNLSGNYT